MKQPSVLYKEQLEQELIQPNKQQEQLIPLLDTLHHQLIQRQQQRDKKINKLRRTIKPRAPIKGIYLWGSVGIGKTYLLDLLFTTLPIKKSRMHFHEFMRAIHFELKKAQGHKNPLQSIAKKIADKNIVLFLDEFIVNDIADAMILSELLSHLFAQGLCLITTSNCRPRNLYLNGIQRERFIPAIALLKHYTTSFELAINIDYRQQFIHEQGVYFMPLNQDTQQKMNASFHLFTSITHPSHQSIRILGRDIDTIAYEKNYLWCDFKTLCSPPRSQNDYLELIKQFDVFFISDIPVLSNNETNTATLFIFLIDVLYDARKGLIISAQSTPEALYTEGKKHVEFQRTVSRLTEMCSEEYSQQFLKQ